MSFTQDQCHSHVSCMDMTRLHMGHGPFTYDTWGQCVISHELHTRPMPNRPLISSTLPLSLSLRTWASHISVSTLNSRMVVIIHTALLLYNLTVNIGLFLYIKFDNSLVRICRALLAVNAYAWIHMQGSFECTGLCWYTDFDKVCFANILGLFVMSNLTTFVCKVRSLKEGEGEGVKEGDLWLILRESGRTWLITLMSHVKAAHVLCVKESHPYLGHGPVRKSHIHIWDMAHVHMGHEGDLTLFLGESQASALPLSRSRTRTHARTHPHTNTLTHTHTHARTNTYWHEQIHLHWHTQIHAHKHTKTHMNTYTYTHTPPLQDQACPQKVACRQWPSAWMKKATWSFLGWLQ